MARENQGLQIALIVFVMLTIVLGVTTFIFFGRYSEELLKVAEAKKQAQQNANQASAFAADCTRLKEMIGVAPTESVTEIEKLFNDDMQKYVGKRDDGGTLPDDQKFYRPLIEQLFVTINARDKQLVAKEEQVRKVDQARADRDTNLLSQNKKYEQSAVDAGDDLSKERETFNSNLGVHADEQKKLAAQLEKQRKDAQAAVAKVQADADAKEKKLVTSVRVSTQLKEKLESMTKEDAESPLGEIRFVNQATGTVWIDLGSADSLSRQISFSVYSPGSVDLTKAGRKASIEVTRITKEHLAEARIVEDKITDPIMPGDKIYTPIWRPGDKKHFALAGILDLNGDGKSDLKLVKNLITMNGGVIDCEPTEKGDERIGEMTANTRYLVLGAEPRNEAGITVWSKMDGDAKVLGVKKITLDDLLQQMGYKDQAPVTQYGAPGAPKGKPADFKPRTVPRSAY